MRTRRRVRMGTCGLLGTGPAGRICREHAGCLSVYLSLVRGGQGVVCVCVYRYTYSYSWEDSWADPRGPSHPDLPASRQMVSVRRPWRWVPLRFSLSACAECLEGELWSLEGVGSVKAARSCRSWRDTEWAWNSSRARHVPWWGFSKVGVLQADRPPRCLRLDTSEKGEVEGRSSGI